MFYIKAEIPKSLKTKEYLFASSNGSEGNSFMRQLSGFTSLCKMGGLLSCKSIKASHKSEERVKI